MKDQGKKGSTADARPEAIGSIWWTALAMLAICIPLCAVLKTASLPFLVLGAAIVSTMYVWTSGHKKVEAREEKEVERLRAKVKDLEERLANVEVINTFEAKLAEKEAKSREAAGYATVVDVEEEEEVRA